MSRRLRGRKSRTDVGDQASAPKHPPYVPLQDATAPLQKDLPSPDAVPTMPATASGSQTQRTDQQDQSIDLESMYDNRPERDKDRPPSSRAR